MERTYLLPVFETVSLAWQKTKGTKASVWGAYGWIAVISFVVGAFDGITSVINIGALISLAVFLKTILPFFTAILFYGVIRLGVRRALEQPLNARMVFYPLTHFMLLLKLVGYWVLCGLVLLVPMLIVFAALAVVFSPDPSNFVLTSGSATGIAIAITGALIMIYLLVRIRMGWAFILDKEIGSWQALKLSYRITRHNVWRLLGLYLVNAVIVIVSIIPLGLGLIWTVPYVLINYGVAYRKLMEAKLAA